MARRRSDSRMFSEDRRESQIQDYQFNERIKAKTVRLVASDGQQMGIMPVSEALERAQQQELDLVEVGPNADPPVCRLLDFGKFKYRQKKKRSHGRHRSQFKEIRIGLNTDVHDLDFKAVRIKEFIAGGNRVVITMRLAGRQKAHQDLAVEHMSQFAQRFTDVARLVKSPERENPGRVSMTLAPM